MAFHVSEFLCSLLHVCNTLTYLQVSFSTIHISKPASSQTRGRVRHSGWRQTTHSGKLSTPESRILLCFSRLHQVPLAFLNTCSTVSEMTPDSCCSAVIQPQDELHCLQLFIWFHLGVRLLPCKAPFWHHYCLIIARNIQVFGSHHLSHLLHDFSHCCTLVAPLNGHRFIAVLSSMSHWLAEVNLVVNFKKSNLHESKRMILWGKEGLSGWINFPSSRRNLGCLKQ